MSSGEQSSMSSVIMVRCRSKIIMATYGEVVNALVEPLTVKTMVRKSIWKTIVDRMN